MEGSPRITDFSNCSYEELRALYEQAAMFYDLTTLDDIKDEAADRDGLDDTDPRYAHLVQDCIDTTKKAYSIDI